MNLSQFNSQIPDEDKTPLVVQLLEIIQMQSEEIQHLRDEIAILKGQKPKPNIKPSKLEEENNKTKNDVIKSSDKRHGSAKK